MTALVAVIFPYATTAVVAAEEVVHLELNLAVNRGAVATVSCDDRGDYHVTTNHPGASGDARAAFWFLLLNALILVPVSGTLSGMDRRTLARRLVEAGIDRPFQRAIREELAAGTSALFLVLDEPDRTDDLHSLRRFVGTLHVTALNPRTEALVAKALYGVPQQDARSEAPAVPAAREDSDTSPCAIG
jgi:uncharacterized membrane protein